MAAKQGLTATISQASEDAKRAVLSRTPASLKSHSWLSNLNTTCTIKSAPPRTPEVMTLLSMKAGWLVKRNEQHVWQRRWCCVVPHTFLYYFEAEPIGDDEDGKNGAGYGHVPGSPKYYDTREGFSGGGINPNISSSSKSKHPPSSSKVNPKVVENQDLLNQAVRDGCTRRSSRSSTPIRRRSGYTETSEGANSSATVGTISPAPVRGPTTGSNSNLSPAGIIDLECYSCVHRSTTNDCVFELCGDDITNPDLRSFYFQAASVNDCDIWTNALLSDRHSALRDEREAYKQVCDSFQLQLQNLSDMIDDAEGKAEQSEKLLYGVRSVAEKVRTKIVGIVREALEHQCWATEKKLRVRNGKQGGSKSKKDKDVILSEPERLTQHLEESRLNLCDQLEEVLGSGNMNSAKDNGTAFAVQLLADYLATVASTYTDLAVQMNSAKQKSSMTKHSDQAILNEYKTKLEMMEMEREEEKKQHQAKIAELEAQVLESQRELEERENHLQSQRMEFTMFQSQAKTKLQELSQHKKILKREVIELRKKNDEITNECDSVKHITDNFHVQVETEKQKNAVLEKYVEKMENQVRVQQNMMEMISLSGMSRDGSIRGTGSGSVVGKVIGPDDDGGGGGNCGNSVGSGMKSQRLPPSVRDVGPSPMRRRLPPSSKSQHGRSSSDVVTPTKEIQREEETSPISMDIEASPNDHGNEVDDGDEEENIARITPRGSLDAQLTEDETEDTPRVQKTSFQSPKRSRKSGNNSSSRNREESNDAAFTGTEPPSIQSSRKSKGKSSKAAISLSDDEQLTDTNDQDSHMSELTEDRTQKQLEGSVQNLLRSARRGDIHISMDDMNEDDRMNGESSNLIRDEKGNKSSGYREGRNISKTSKSSTQAKADKQEEDYPPRYILGSGGGGAESTTDYSQKSKSKSVKLTVAQRSRLEALSKSNQMSISAGSLPGLEMDANENKQDDTAQTTTETSTTSARTRSESPSVRILSNLGKSFVDALDNSVIGVKTEDNSRSSSPPKSSSNAVNVSGEISETSLSLQERQQLQRERQLRVLKERGLLKKSEGGASAANGSQSTRDEQVSSSSPMRRFSRR